MTLNFKDTPWTTSPWRAQRVERGGGGVSAVSYHPSGLQVRTTLTARGSALQKVKRGCPRISECSECTRVRWCAKPMDTQEQPRLLPVRLAVVRAGRDRRADSSWGRRRVDGRAEATRRRARAVDRRPNRGVPGGGCLQVDGCLGCRRRVKVDVEPGCDLAGRGEAGQHP
jgi:hypothetical protein